MDEPLTNTDESAAEAPAGDKDREQSVSPSLGDSPEGRWQSPATKSPSVAERDVPTLARRLLNQVAVFNYVTAQNAPTYRAIMHAFYEAKQHYTIELRPSQVLEDIRSSGFHTEIDNDSDLEYHLGQLVEWGNLTRSHDTASVERIDDFYRKLYVYHLTAAGEAAYRAVVDVEASVGKSGSLQTTMLAKVRDALRMLAELADPGDADMLVRGLHDLNSAFDTLTEEANRFIGDLNRYFGADRLEEERFVLHKQAVLAYIGRFVQHLRRLREEIAVEIIAVRTANIESLLERASTCADLPPVLDDRDPIASWIAEQTAKWDGVCAWFLGQGTTNVVPTVERLAEVAVGAVVGLTRSLGRLNDRRTRPVDRAADFRALARWFSACPTQRHAHELWQASFGLYSARHLQFEEDDEELTNPQTSWWDAEPIEVPVHLRARGHIAKGGRPSPAPDHSMEKRWAAERRRRERFQLQSAQERFSGRGLMSIRDIASLESAEFDLLLNLLDEAMNSARMPDGTRKTRTADGRLTVELHAPERNDRNLVELRTERGILRCRNYRIEVRDNALRSRVDAVRRSAPSPTEVRR